MGLLDFCGAGNRRPHHDIGGRHSNVKLGHFAAPSLVFPDAFSAVYRIMQAACGDSRASRKPLTLIRPVDKL
jgi:hypothetical protein